LIVFLLLVGMPSVLVECPPAADVKQCASSLLQISVRQSLQTWVVLMRDYGLFLPESMQLFTIVGIQRQSVVWAAV
jgi:hypothetical protein